MVKQVQTSYVPWQVSEQGLFLFFSLPRLFLCGGFGSVWDSQTAAAGKPERQSVSKAGKGGKENSSRAGEKRKKELLVFVGANFSFLFSLSSPLEEN